MFDNPNNRLTYERITSFSEQTNRAVEEGKSAELRGISPIFCNWKDVMEKEMTDEQFFLKEVRDGMEKLQCSAELELSGRTIKNGYVMHKTDSQKQEELESCNHVLVRKDGTTWFCPNCGNLFHSQNGHSFYPLSVSVDKCFEFSSNIIERRAIISDPISGFIYPNSSVDYSLMYLRAVSEIEKNGLELPDKDRSENIANLMKTYIEEEEEKSYDIAYTINKMRFGLKDTK